MQYNANEEARSSSNRQWSSGDMDAVWQSNCGLQLSRNKEQQRINDMCSQYTPAASIVKYLTNFT
jgi:hypothetical protein